ncbi:MAG: hypothetical protein B6226_02640 [Candidatus Cloacimonetes bacterium 4572_65]|nr:MAG: hypothetical protein B6226_02640 [Candidatus Cloacimonetes bacterium 4572_65]
MRISIIGTSCSGKTTLAKRVSRELGLEHFELDSIYWLPNWDSLPKEQFVKEVSQVADEVENWVIDGNYKRVREILWQKSNVIIWLNYPFHIVFYRCIERTFRRAFKQELLFNNNVESIKTSFFSKDSIILWVLKTYKRRKREYPLMLAEQKRLGKVIVEIKHPRFVDSTLEKLMEIRLNG